MNRRTMLRNVGSATAVVVLAGCTGGPDEGENETGGTETKATNTTTGTRTASATAQQTATTEGATGTTGEPTETGTATDEATQSPTERSTDSPTAEPTDSPTAEPTETATAEPTDSPTPEPTPQSTETPTSTDSPTPTDEPSGGGTNSFKFNGRLSGWYGRKPESIEGEEDPTISMRAGETYEVTWVNGDGYTHRFAIADEQGNKLLQSEKSTEEGVTKSITFEATEQMASYFCTFHRSSMSGQIQIES